MDLREVQQLHAQFARRSITIDMPARAGTGEPLALPSPSQVRTAARQQWSALGQRTRVLAMVLGIIGAAGAGGVFVAKMQHHWTTVADDRQPTTKADTRWPAVATISPLPASSPVEAPAPPASRAPAVAPPAESLAPASVKPLSRQDDPPPQQSVANRSASGNGTESMARNTTPSAQQRHPTSAPASGSPTSPQKAVAPRSAEVKMF